MFFFGVSNADKSPTYYSIFTFLYSSDRKYGIKLKGCMNVHTFMNVQTSNLYYTEKKIIFSILHTHFYKIHTSIYLFYTFIQ